MECVGVDDQIIVECSDPTHIEGGGWGLIYTNAIIRGVDVDGVSIDD